MPIKRTKSGTYKKSNGKRSNRMNTSVSVPNPKLDRASFKASYNGIVSRYQPSGSRAGSIVRVVAHEHYGIMAPILIPSQFVYNQPITFNMLNVPNVSNYQFMYDAYRIVKAVVTIIPNVIDTMGSATTSQRSMGEIWSCIDTNSVSSGLSEGGYLAYSTFKRTAFDKEHVRVVYPRQTPPSYSSIAATAYQQSSSPEWVPFYNGTTAQLSVAHYGLNIGVVYDSSGPSPVPPAGINQQTWRVMVEYTIDLKSPI